MKQFEITTPVLQESVALFRNATDGTLESSEARNAISAGNGIIRAVGQELKVRLAMPKIAAMEAKMIEPNGDGDKARIGQQEAA